MTSAAANRELIAAAKAVLGGDAYPSAGFGEYETTVRLADLDRLRDAIWAVEHEPSDVAAA